jgi:hypothetical protein
MTRILIVSFVSLVASFGPNTAQAISTGLDLLQSCQQLERTAHTSGDRIIWAQVQDADICWGYIQAVQQFSVLVNPDTKQTIIYSCPPPDSTTLQFVRIVTAYARSHPQQLHDQAMTIAMKAIQAAFPCH